MAVNKFTNKWLGIDAGEVGRPFWPAQEFELSHRQ